jgi:hypothetical protein
LHGSNAAAPVALCSSFGPEPTPLAFCVPAGPTADLPGPVRGAVACPDADPLFAELPAADPCVCAAEVPTSAPLAAGVGAARCVVVEDEEEPQPTTPALASIAISATAGRSTFADGLVRVIDDPVYEPGWNRTSTQ